jgi:hypothetical protein
MDTDELRVLSTLASHSTRELPEAEFAELVGEAHDTGTRMSPLRVLERLENNGWITVRWDEACVQSGRPGGAYYRITADGLARARHLHRVDDGTAHRTTRHRGRPWWPWPRRRLRRPSSGEPVTASTHDAVHGGSWSDQLAVIAGHHRFPGRSMNYLLDGRVHAPGDRLTAEQWRAANPRITDTVRAAREFQRRAVHAALACGIRRFVDLSTGAATTGAPHELLAEIPQASVGYVCPDLLALFAPSLVFFDPTARRLDARHMVVEADPREPLAAWTRLLMRWRLPQVEPVALLAVGVADYLAHLDEDLVGLLADWLEVLPPGSLLVLSAAMNTAVHRGSDPEYDLAEMVESAGWTLDAPVTRAHRWRPPGGSISPTEKFDGAAVTDKVPADTRDALGNDAPDEPPSTPVCTAVSPGPPVRRLLW